MNKKKFFIHFILLLRIVSLGRGNGKTLDRRDMPLSWINTGDLVVPYLDFLKFPFYWRLCLNLSTLRIIFIYPFFVKSVPKLNGIVKDSTILSITIGVPSELV